jgi:hypothetical protein
MDSKFKIGDRAFNACIDETGEIIEIWHRERPNRTKHWVYRMKGMTRFSTSWWSENQLFHPDEVKHG